MDPTDSKFDSILKTAQGTAVSAELNELAMYMTSLAKATQICVLGFIWGGEPPMITYFSNINETEPKDVRRVLEALMRLREQKHREGLVECIDLSKASKA